jgi:hypothetical protein
MAATYPTVHVERDIKSPPKRPLWRRIVRKLGGLDA